MLRADNKVFNNYQKKLKKNATRLGNRQASTINKSVLSGTASERTQAITELKGISTHILEKAATRAVPPPCKHFLI
jgi:hypothetical protein